MRLLKTIGVVLGCVALVGAAAGFVTRDLWRPWVFGMAESTKTKDEQQHAVRPPSKVLQVKVSPQAQKNLRLVSERVKLQNYPRTIQVPGVIIDRPGHSDRGVTAPAVGVVTKVHAFPGDTVKVGERLITLRLISEYLQNTQSELFKATGEVELVKKEKERLKEAAQVGGLSAARIIELDNQLRRLATAMQAYSQDLLTRGLTPPQLESVRQGKFISEIEVLAPQPSAPSLHLINGKVKDSATSQDLAPAYEVQELKAELGQQVQAGQLISVLANHQSLYIEGHSFRREAPFLEEAAKKGWEVRVQFDADDNRTASAEAAKDKAEDDSAAWLPLKQTFQIRHLANSVDTTSRTFAFYLPLANQSRSYTKGDKTFLVWRFRPGQRVRLHVPVEQFTDVIVLPAAAVVREGPEAYVFAQNGELFERRPVHVLYEDRLNVVLEADGSVRPGIDYLAQGAAASLNRILKAQNASGGLPPGAHFHADGSLHVPGK